MNGLAGSATITLGPGSRVHYRGPQAWLQRVAVGRPSDQLPALMANVHTLCAHGHGLAARLALRAARGEAAEPAAAEREALALAVARDHLLRMAHDWPRLLPAADGQPLPLQHAPCWQAGLSDTERLALLPAWLEHHWLAMPATALQAALVADGADAAQAWARRTPGALARLLSRELPPALALATPQRPLQASVTMPLVMPTHAAPDTGPWSRRHDAAPLPTHNAGMRLIARLLDLLRVAAPEGAAWLWAAGQPVAPGRGRAWVEVGRGLLGYEVALDEQAGTVRALQLLSPTDWNLHADGVLAQSLRHVEDTAAATRLAVAFDPCVPFTITTAQEATHA